jgi:uncharacterized membrane protein HdeD (DUF308 family)
MGLKGFHVVFILLSIATAAGFGLWAIDNYLATQDVVILCLGIASLLAGAALLGYLIWFVSKIRKLKQE